MSRFSLLPTASCFHFIEPAEAQPAAPPERPVSEIKYIDEDNDDETETDRLLPPSQPASDAGGQRTPTSSDSEHSREQDSDENAPMIVRGGPNNVNDTSS